ncbi:nucleotidyltransferase family protein [Salinarimonas chemoclinalis]|uniref:nucleotidyltransferase family protein n=1 Tax=Salinarimonas chemoclinalis TaxID=3241599 RepID=UPI003557D9BA
MAVVTAADLQRRSAEVQRTASREPVFITRHETPRYALLSLEDLVRTGAHRALMADGGLPDAVMRRLEALGKEIVPYDRRAPTLDDVRHVVETHREELRANGIQGLWVVGSVARGEATSRSDVDLVVSFAPDHRVSLLDLGVVNYDFSQWLGRDIDVLRWEAIPEGAATRVRSEAIRVL